jgi:outer membrane protein assembly factor BamB
MFRAMLWHSLATTAVLLRATSVHAVDESTWPQFRGPDARGVAAEGASLPADFGPEKNVLWKVELPTGHSSPCVWNDRIFLTGFDKQAGKLETFCIDRSSGSILWRQGVVPEKIEKVHQISSPATATPVTDGQRVCVYFGSYGIVCYDFEGQQQWELRLPAPVTRFGSGSSPVLTGETLLLNCEYSPKPTLLAIDLANGEVRWKQERSAPSEGYATPVVWRHDDLEEVIVHTPARLASHDLADGSLRWWVNLNSVACSTPVVAGGKLFVATWMHGGEPEDRVAMPSFNKLLDDHDKDKDGKLSKAEFPANLAGLRRAEAGDIPGAAVNLVKFFEYLDPNKDGHIDRLEWLIVQAFAAKPTEHGLLCIRSGGTGDITQSHVAWREKLAVPEVPSPVYFGDRIYMIKDGGILSCLEAESGKLLYRSRVGANGAYFASLVAGDGKLYAASHRGIVTVIAAGDKFESLGQSDFKDPIFATPALVDGRIYLRTEKHLYALGTAP